MGEYDKEAVDSICEQLKLQTQMHETAIEQIVIKNDTIRELRAECENLRKFLREALLLMTSVDMQEREQWLRELRTFFEEAKAVLPKTEPTGNSG